MSPDGVTGTTAERSAVPAPAASAPAASAGLVAAGLLAVVVLPELGAAMPWEIDPEPNASQTALTALGVLLLTAAYVWSAVRTTGWSRTSAALTLGFLAGIGVVKFILSPASFSNTADVTLARYLWLGLVVMLLYVTGLVGVYAVAGRGQGWPVKAGAVAGVVAFALASRYVAALVLGRDVDDYLGDVFSGGWIWLLLLLGASALAAAEAFSRPGRDMSLRAGLVVIVAYHGLWVAYMLGLF